MKENKLEILKENFLMLSKTYEKAINTLNNSPTLEEIEQQYINKKISKKSYLELKSSILDLISIVLNYEENRDYLINIIKMETKKQEKEQEPSNFKIFCCIINLLFNLFGIFIFLNLLFIYIASTIIRIIFLILTFSSIFGYISILEDFDKKEK